MKLTGSQIFVEVLVEQGVDTLFGYPGGTVLNLYDELYKNSDRIRHVLTAHEQGASHAADGYARATGRTGVVLATSGPGATNLVTGIATAYMDSVPMVALYGSKDDGKQAEGKYLYDDKAVRADSLVHSLAHGFVLVGLNILKQFACSSCQQNTNTLQPLIAVGYHYLLTVIGTLLLIAYLRKGISYAVSNV